MENCQPRPQPSSRRHVSELVEVVRSMAQAKFAVVATSAVTFFISICVMLASVSSALAENTRGPYEHESYLVLPNQKCKIPPMPKWTKPEKWVWEKICEGKVADFNKRPDSRLFYPREQEDCENWSDQTLRSSFLETILLHEPFRSAIPRQGVRIIGACFPEPIDLSDALIDRPLTLSLSLFRSKVDMRHLTTSSFIALGGSTFNRMLDMDSVTVGGSLLMGDEAEFDYVSLERAKVGGDIIMSDSTFNGKLYMVFVTVEGSLFMDTVDTKESDTFILLGVKVGGDIIMSYSTFNGKLYMVFVTVEGSLFMYKNEFDYVSLEGAKVGGNIDMDGSTFNDTLDMRSVTVEGSLFMGESGLGDLLLENINKFSIVLLNEAKIGSALYMDDSEFNGKLDMRSVTVGGSLYMRKKAKFGEVLLNGAKIGSALYIDGSKFNGKLDMRSVTVGGSLYMRKKAKFGEVLLNGAKIGSALYIDGSKFNGDLHMDFVTVNGTLMMQKAIFEKGADLLLRHSNAGTLMLQDKEEHWPEIFRLDGFTYQGLDWVVDEVNHVDPSKHESGWFEEWLKKHKPYSPQPYWQLASVLRTSGREDIADDILVASRNREWEKSEMLKGEGWGLFLLKIFINYGYGMWKVLLPLIWGSALVVIGVLVLDYTKERDRHEGEIHKLLDTMFYSLDMLLPIIRLRELHYKNVDLKTMARYYFYFHKIMGYVLIFFLIAVLSGLAS